MVSNSFGLRFADSVKHDTLETLKKYNPNQILDTSPILSCGPGLDTLDKLSSSYGGGLFENVLLSFDDLSF